MRNKHLAFFVVTLAAISMASLVAEGQKEGAAFTRTFKEITGVEYNQLAQAYHLKTVDYDRGMRLTMGLMRGQTMGYLFHPTSTTSKAVFKGWLDNCNDLINSKDDEHYLDITDGILKLAKKELEDLVGGSSSILDIPYRDLYLTVVTFPQELTNLAKPPINMHLPFLYVNHDDPANMLNIRVTLEQLRWHGKFSNFELSDFYHTQLSPKLFTDDDMDLAGAAFALGLLRANEQGIGFEVLNMDTNEWYHVRYEFPRGAGFCCNKTTRKCVSGLITQSCNMCGLYCCAGATMCPLP